MQTSRGPDEVHQMVKMKVLVTQMCLTLFNSMDFSLPGFSVHGFLQARILGWVAISFSRGSSQPRTEPRSLGWQADSLPWEPPGKPRQVVVTQSTAKLLGVMRSTQDTASLHTNAGDCYSGYVQRVAFLLFKRHQNWKMGYMYPIVHCSAIYNS